MAAVTLRAIPGHHVITGVAALILAHELSCLAARQPEDLITRVIARWRRKHPVIVTTAIVYLAGHLLDAWAYDPLQVR